jgi:hypothetical protein
MCAVDLTVSVPGFLELPADEPIGRLPPALTVEVADLPTPPS